MTPATRSRRTLRHQYYLRASPKKAFKAVSDPKRLTGWLADTAELTARKGGRFSVGWKNGPTHQGKILEFSRGRSITFGWSWDGYEDVGATRFRLSVEPKGKGTLLTVTHAGFPRTERGSELYESAEWGWTYFVMNLKSVLETGTDLRSKHDG